MRVTLETRPAGPALVVKGDVDHENIGALMNALQSIIDIGSPSVVLDLARVTYIDSAGIGAIYDLLEKVNGAKDIEMTGVSSNLRRIFQVSGLTVRHGVRILPEDEASPETPMPTLPRPRDRKLSPSRTKTFAGQLDQLARIRDFIGGVARDAELDTERTFNLQVAVSEASANAIEHGLPRGDLELSALCAEGRLTVTVSHPGSFQPRVEDDPTRSHRGMGLPLMLALTDEVMVSRPPGDGTRVTLALYLK